MPEVKTPDLIQRCTIRRPLLDKGRFSERVETDYMGSSEFEYGAMPKSLRRLQAHVNDIKLTVDPRIKDGDRSLRVLHTFAPEEFEEYFQFLLRMRRNDLYLKEQAKFEEGAKHWGSRVIDLWWDVENDVMFSFDKIFMNRLGDTLVESWKYMDEQKAKG